MTEINHIDPEVKEQIVHISKNLCPKQVRDLNRLSFVMETFKKLIGSSNSRWVTTVITGIRNCFIKMLLIGTSKEQLEASVKETDYPEWQASYWIDRINNSLKK